jgi:hypothetical protein
MQYTLYKQYLAQAYGSNAYSSSTYSTGTTTGSTGNTGSNGGGTLANTGVAIAGFVTLACLILLAAIVVRVWRRSNKKTEETIKTVENE